ncbi:MAG: asparagine synthetase A [Candidatus Woesearchaeota archaeon]
MQEYEKDLEIFLGHMKKVAEIVPIQTTILQEIVDYFVEKEFNQLMPVILSTVTDPLAPDPSSTVKKTLQVEAYDQKLMLTQSMILHKQTALISGMKRIFIVSPNVRLEDDSRKDTGKHCFEFSQVDFEIAYAKKEDVFDLIEELLVRIIKKVTTKHEDLLKKLGRSLAIPKRPFKIFTTYELEEKYGKDWEFKASKDATDPFWVLDHKREFYDKEDPKNKGHFLNYDLIYPEGYGEALSGGERETDYDIIVRKLRENKREDIILKYPTFFELAKRKLLVPSAGGGFGVERLVRFITGKNHIRDVQLFPRIPGEKVFM